MKLLRMLLAVIDEGLSVRPEQPITCRRSEPELDLAVVRHSPDDYIDGHPEMAELAISSIGIDRRKIAIYAEAGVREYLIVLPDTCQTEVCTNLTQGQYAVQRVFAEGQTASSEVLPTFQVELAALFPR